jgi:hypothetical protein
MLQLIKKLWKLLPVSLRAFVAALRIYVLSIKTGVPINPQESLLFQYFKGLPRHADMPGNVLLVQCVEDIYYFGLFGQMVSSLREQHPIRVEQFVLRSLNLGESKSVREFIFSRLMNAIHNRKWTGLYNSFCDGIAYCSTSFHPVYDLADIYRAWICWRSLNDRKALIDLEINNIAVGDLVNDSFLRFKPAPTVDLQDFYLFILLWQAHRDIRRAEAYFLRVKPKLFFTSYTTYIQHGIAVRVALKHKVRVCSFGNHQEFAKELSITDWVHTKNPDSYSKDFLAVEAQEEKLNIAETGLMTRLSGGVDSATAYMKKSAYAESGEAVPDVRGAAVIFLHDFYDSPHVYREMVFPDFWEWVCFTIETFRGANIPFFVKSHPNQIDLSDGVLNELKELYQDIQLIPSGITNKQLAGAKMTCAVTVYGTVAHEMAYFGVPTIACARHPHTSFDFCRTARNREEYAKMLCHYADIAFDKAKMRRQSLIFYYMHNLNLAEEEMSLRNMAEKFRTGCERFDGMNPDLVVNHLEKISMLQGYKNQISKWLNAI